jgi:hypothetical protein
MGMEIFGFTGDVSLREHVLCILFYIHKAVCTIVVVALFTASSDDPSALHLSPHQILVENQKISSDPLPFET